MSPEARIALLAWFDARGRSLAFRGSRDPYAILVSEVMAQQTQISRVVDAWGRFLRRFPTVETLAAASPADVLRAWQGMGYDRRALNLRRAAIVICDEHGGRVPDDLAALERLPGIGPYTARAVASIAFGRAVGAVDTNVRRVLGRVLAGGDRAAATMPRPRVQAAADASVDPERPADWTHAMMDVGATLCRPRNPRCAACPLRPWCRFVAVAAVVDDGAAAPSSSPRTPRPSRRVSPGVPFTSTTRWLRGRVVDRLRAANADSWTTLDRSIGDHDSAAVARAVLALARDGVLEIDPTDPERVRLATG